MGWCLVPTRHQGITAMTVAMYKVYQHLVAWWHLYASMNWVMIDSGSVHVQQYIINFVFMLSWCQIDGLEEQVCCNSSVLAVGLPQSCATPSKWTLRLNKTSSFFWIKRQQFCFNKIWKCHQRHIFHFVHLNGLLKVLKAHFIQISLMITCE